ncbi:hypothetical protein ACFY0F_02140 [Streptomyces sp. NPDC001544]|uniref:hypothetical protein n=1 Tax=Streptomyces sp. NPDC001544 TaxID=3364584 RepID=UPI003685DBC7
MAAMIGGIFLLIVALLAAVVLVGKKVESSYPRAEYAVTVPRALLADRTRGGASTARRGAGTPATRCHRAQHLSEQVVDDAE